MESYTLIKWILIYFFLARQVRLLVTLVTHSLLAGALVGDVAIFVLIFFYVTYSLGIGQIRKSSFDRVKIVLLSVLALSFWQSVYFVSTLGGSGESIVLRGFSSFRRMFFPLSLLFLFSFLLKNEFNKRGEFVFQKFVRLFKVFLYISATYNFCELILRSTVPAFNSFYINYYLAHVVTGGVSMPDFSNELAGRLVGFNVKRIYGIGLDGHQSGAFIFSCYLFYAFLLDRFKVMSGFNAIIFGSLLLLGSRQFVLPFLVVNAVILFNKYKKKDRFVAALLIPVFGVILVSLLIVVLMPTFTNEMGYFSLIKVVKAPLVTKFMDDPGIFILGRGPAEITVYGGEKLAEELQENTRFYEIENYGWLLTLFEIGIIGILLFVTFHIVLFREGVVLGSNGRKHDKYVTSLKLIILLNLFVSLAHQAILIDRTVFVFYVLFVSLFYSWSRFKGVSPQSGVQSSTSAVVLGPVLSR